MYMLKSVGKKSNMKKNGQYILFHLLLSLRGVIRIIFKFFILICIIGLIGSLMSENSGIIIPLILIGGISYLLMIYYDKLLFKMKPDDMELWLKK